MRAAREQARLDDLDRLLCHAVPEAGELQGRLRTSLEQCHRPVDQFAKRIGEGAADLAPPGSGVEVNSLVNEVVALLLTRLLRERGMDSDAFDVAEALLSELTALAAVPTLVLGHSQDREQHDCIHGRADLRFPGSRVWDVPFLAHEFGHHAVAHLPDRRPELRDRRPLRDSVRDRLRDQLARQEWPLAASASEHADELVADAVATVCCGPAYVVATLCLRVPEEPEASVPRPSHPAWRDRVAVMRETLNELTRQTCLGRYAAQREDPVDLLAVAVLGQPPEARGVYRDAARQTVEKILAHRKDLVYRDGDAAIDVQERLGQRKENPPERATVAAVLDGGWRWRLAHPARTEDNTTARLIAQYCREIAKGRRHG